METPTTNNGNLDAGTITTDSGSLNSLDFAQNFTYDLCEPVNRLTLANGVGAGRGGRRRDRFWIFGLPLLTVAAQYRVSPYWTVMLTVFATCPSAVKMMFTFPCPISDVDSGPMLT
jgi:hypothetical protein